jgi:hypothetical protein
VVRDDGETSCVEIGNAAAGQACDTDRCGPGLACLGVPGSRRCFQLCRTANPAACSAPQVCKGGKPLFSDGYGICVTP